MTNAETNWFHGTRALLRTQAEHDSGAAQLLMGASAQLERAEGLDDPFRRLDAALLASDTIALVMRDARKQSEMASVATSLEAEVDAFLVDLVARVHTRAFDRLMQMSPVADQSPTCRQAIVTLETFRVRAAGFATSEAQWAKQLRERLDYWRHYNDPYDRADRFAAMWNAIVAVNRTRDDDEPDVTHTQLAQAGDDYLIACIDEFDAERRRQFQRCLSDEDQRELRTRIREDIGRFEELQQFLMAFPRWRERLAQCRQVWASPLALTRAERAWLAEPGVPQE